MYLDYQTYSSLQENYNLTNAQIKAFLLIAERLRRFPASNISRKYIAQVLELSVRHIDNILKLLKDKGLLSWSHRPKMYNDFNHYVITPTGKIWMPYFKNTYKVRTGIFKRAMLSIALLLSPSPSEFSLLREDIYIYPTVECKLQKRAPEKRVAMSSSLDSKEMIVAQELLSLSKWGMIRLTAFPGSALEYACAAFRSSKSAKEDPFRWFAGICNKWCKENNVEPNWPYMARLANEHEMPEEPQYIVARPSVVSIPTTRRGKVVECRQPKSEEEVFISKIETLDKLKGKGELNEFARILAEGFTKQIHPFMNKSEKSNEKQDVLYKSKAHSMATSASQ